MIFRGNYNVKDLTDVLIEPVAQESDFINRSFITTVIAIVPALSVEDFLNQYELLTDNVIPYSAKKLKVPEKDGLTIWYFPFHIGPSMSLLPKSKKIRIQVVITTTITHLIARSMRKNKKETSLQ